MEPPSLPGNQRVVRPIREKKALSQVVSTLVLLVVTILLAAVVTYYATNMTTVRTETEEIQLTFEHIWINSTGAIGAFKVKNLGGRDILIDKITVRGVEQAWSDVFVYRVPSGSSVTSDLTVCDYTAMLPAGFVHQTYTYNQSSADIALISGGEMLVYIKDPDNVQMDDIGTAVGMSVFTANAQYTSECNVESATTQ